MLLCLLLPNGLEWNPRWGASGTISRFSYQEEAGEGVEVGEKGEGIKGDLYIMYKEQNYHLKDLATTYTEKPMIHRRSYPVPAPLESKKQSLFLKIDLLDCSSFSYPLINKSRN